ncbi:hypothetical protein AB4212_58650, partial [Streptomyces sp. 2MCAF27]
FVIVAAIGLFFYGWGVTSAWRNPSLVQAERELAAEAAEAANEAAGEADDDRREKATAGV